MRFSICLAATLWLAGCADPARSPFDPAAAAFIHDHGEGVLEGHAFAVNQLGSTINAAGQRIYLFPATPYVRERFARQFFGGHDMPSWVPDLYSEDPFLRDYVRTTVADAGGLFRFDGLVPGTYVVMTQVSWQLDSRLLPDGKRMFETVMVTGNETKPVRVILAGT